MCACVRACVCACVRACVCVCVMSTLNASFNASVALVYFVLVVNVLNNVNFISYYD